ncbi:YdbC family protein [Anaerovorax sp. IOR16]|uniref:YdbC family protein n=1 Tax=Anaerovorax sp. IOR16 TaxID=2773458 RepID=UPI0019CFB3A3|nr:PC4/YdbC family ssDNA-binding protein [Anaerovorax sp. IOR16]
MAVTYKIIDSFGTLSRNEKSGWKKELNLVSWNDGEQKLDIREWSEDHSKMSKGITLTKEEAVALKKALNEINLN